MKELMTSVRGSVYNPIFYRELLSKPFSYSLKYYSAFALLVVIFLTIASSIPLIASANKVAHEFPKKFFDYIPDNLEVTVTKGIVSTNAEEPFAFPIPAALRSSMETPEIVNLLVIDTKTSFSVAQFAEYHTLAWLGGDQWVYRDQKGGALQIQPIDPKVNLVVNEPKLRGFESMISAYYKYIGPIIVVLIFIALCLIYVGYMLYLLFGGLLIYILLRVMKMSVTYGKAYQIGLHAITLPILLQFLFSISNIPLLQIPFLPTLILLAVVYLNFKNSFTPPVSGNIPPAVLS